MLRSSSLLLLCALTRIAALQFPTAPVSRRAFGAQAAAGLAALTVGRQAAHAEEIRAMAAERRQLAARTDLTSDQQHNLRRELRASQQRESQLSEALCGMRRHVSRAVRDLPPHSLLAH